MKEWEWEKEREREREWSTWEWYPHLPTQKQQHTTICFIQFYPHSLALLNTHTHTHTLSLSLSLPSLSYSLSSLSLSWFVFEYVLLILRQKQKTQVLPAFTSPTNFDEINNKEEFNKKILHTNYSLLKTSSVISKINNISIIFFTG